MTYVAMVEVCEFSSVEKRYGKEKDNERDGGVEMEMEMRVVWKGERGIKRKIGSSSNLP